MQSQVKHEMFKISENDHQIFIKENMKAAPDKSDFFSPVLNSLDIFLKETKSL